MGWDRALAKEAPKRKSFQILVVCQITVTMITGAELGRIMLQEILMKFFLSQRRCDLSAKI
jgi:hypothetical protein